MRDLRDFIGPNAAYVLDLHERFRRDPEAVDAGWRDFFRSFTPPAEPAALAPSTNGAASGDAAAATERLAAAIRAWGHTAARLDPLGDERLSDPRLDPTTYGLPADALADLRAAYEGSTGYEFSHLRDAEQRRWLEEAVEEGRFRAPADAAVRRALLERLSEVEGFEKYLHKAFFGQKRFSIEGTDMLVPMIDALVEAAGESGAARVVVGMAHRGRLNVLTHVLGKPYGKTIAGFVTASADPERVELNPAGASGDVKYHLGWKDEHSVDGHDVAVVLAPNPSHLEFVNPVVLGMVRASQDRTEEPGLPEVDPSAALAVLVHGDAAFTGQGVVAETLNLAGLPGYSVGGTIHLIANNQVGFTTSPNQGRATRYASDPARGYDVPVIHVNADHAGACLGAVRLAHAFRERFHGDVVVDLVGYRRWGHNEGDEPAFTQPRMYEQIRSHPTVRERLAEELVRDGVLTREEAEALLQRTLDRMSEAQEALGGEEARPEPQTPSRDGLPAPAAPEAVSAERLEELNAELLSWPDGFEPNSRLARLLERRRGLADAAIDWGHAEALAFASLLAEGTPIRLTGQDAERGTFSHRHAVLHDAETGTTYAPLATLPQARASCEIRNSPLSETAALGFEYGYSVFDPSVLVLWEAQFGDFANGAQVVLDQFLAAARQKWEQLSGVVLLLPHGYEGQGPEHSSARLERFLQLAAEDNLRVVNCTTSAQYFHLLRRHAASLADDRRPLVVMSPKSLLRHPLAAASLDELANGSFRPVLPDPDAADRANAVTRLLLCSGKVWVDLVGGSDAQREERAEIAGRERVALARVEELYPFPAELLEEMVAGLPALQEIVWVQEEPRNMGAWTYVEPRLRALAGGLPVHYVGRPERASPATGSPAHHAAEQAALVEQAWSDAPAAAAPATSANRPRERERTTQPA
ncbi:MAG: 2-oxoglutarate dehydrogenase E1 component [Longimicrobiaceae bacterium]